MDSSKKYINVSPEENANFVSKLFYCWFLPFFKFGYKNNLQAKDIHSAPKKDLSEQWGDELQKNWNKEVVSHLQGNKKPSLKRAIFKTFYKKYIIYGIGLLLRSVIRSFLIPLVLAEYIKFFDQSVVKKDQRYGWTLGLVMILLTIINIPLSNNINLQCQKVGMRVRLASSSLVYRKMLRLNHHALAETTGGQVINLLTNDVERFNLASMFLHYIWIMPIQAAISFYLIFQNVGLAGLSGLVAIFLQSVVLQGYLSRLQGKMRYKVALTTDSRVKFMNEILTGIKVIKMYAWEKPFKKLMELTRRLEMNNIRKSSYLIGLYVSMMVFTERIVVYCIIVTFAALGQRLTGDVVYFIVQIINNVQLFMSIFYPLGLSSYAEVKVSINRFKDGYNKRSELLNILISLFNKQNLPTISRKHMVLLSGMIYINKKLLDDTWCIFLTGTYFETLNEKLANNQALESMKSQPIPKVIDTITLNAQNNDTFLLMEERTSNEDSEIEAKPGQIKLTQVSASWSSNPIIPTLTNISLNIQAGTFCCVVGKLGAGKSTLLQLILKELSPTAGKMNVSGKIAYASQEPWLFGSNVRQNILFGKPFFKERYNDVIEVCALERDFQQFPYGDKTLVGERGVSLSGGQKARINLARAVYSEADIYLLDDPLSAVDSHVGRHIFQKCMVNYLKNKTRILVTHQLQFVKEADLIIIINDGKIENISKYTELSETQLNYFQHESGVNEKEESNTNGSREEKRKSVESLIPSDGPNETDELIEKGMVSSSVLKEYLKSGGNIVSYIFLIFVLLKAQIACNGYDLWLMHWTNEEQFGTLFKESNGSANNTMDSSIFSSFKTFYDSRYYYIFTFSMLMLASMIFTIARSWLLYKICLRSATVLHNKMITKVLQTPLRFFNINPSGRILNRFSKDIGTIDEVLPRAALDVIQTFLVFGGILVMIIQITPLMIVPAAVLGSIYFYFCVLYLRISQDLQRLESVAKAPVLTHISSSMDGISTIRVSSAEQMLIKEFDVLQDQHTGSWLTIQVCTTAFGFYLDVMNTIFIALVSLQFLIFKNETTLTGNVGLVISQCLIISGMVQYGLRSGANFMSNLVSVERVLQYTKLDEEGPFDSLPANKPNLNWPEKGKIVFSKVCLRYGDDLPTVLQNVNIEVNAGEKIGVVGRTGAGKSSLVASLFRLAPIDGIITIDGVDISQIGLNDLRQNISIIPQDPVLFSASIRYNLDPTEKYTDEMLWGALESVELKGVVNDLNQKVSEGGNNFSVGQRQLICLARAIVQNNKIFVMDEATANVDRHTDTLIQTTIRKKFKDCTVLTIAHRLNTIMDSDRVLVMDAGQVMEFEHPHKLLQNPEGYFSKMITETGAVMEKVLIQIAKEDYKKKESNRSDI